MARLKRYLDRWTELAEANESVAAIKDLFIREQLINTCSKELALFLKERVPKTIDEATRLASNTLRHMVAHSTRRDQVQTGEYNSRNSQLRSNNSPRQRDQTRNLPTRAATTRFASTVRRGVISHASVATRKRTNGVVLPQWRGEFTTTVYPRTGERESHLRRTTGGKTRVKIPR